MNFYLVCADVSICYSPAGRSVQGKTVPGVLSMARGTELENLVEEILVLKESADVEMKEDDESVNRKAEDEKAKATDMRLKALEKVSEAMKRERRSGSETMLFQERKDQELKLEELQLKKERHDLDAKRLQASIDQQYQFQQ